MTDDVERKKNEIFPVRLAEAYQNNLDMLIQTAYWVVKDRQHAEAVVHDVIERLLRSGPPPDFDKNPRGYLYRAVFNQGISFLRSRGADSVIDQTLDDPDLILSAADWEEDVNIKLALKEALSKLDPELTAVLSLHYWEGYEYEKIAAMTGRTWAGVSMTMVRARRQVKKLLSETLRRPRPKLNKLEPNRGGAQ